jgi:hypothetical protein
MTNTMSDTVRWVVLHHTGVAQPHFDLMYEESPGGTLTTWRIPEWPILQYLDCTQLGQHRRDYLTYEGPVSGDRGSVKRIAAGRCIVETLRRDDVAWRIELRDEIGAPFLTLELGATGWYAVPQAAV